MRSMWSNYHLRDDLFIYNTLCVHLEHAYNERCCPNLGLSFIIGSANKSACMQSYFCPKFMLNCGLTETLFIRLEPFKHTHYYEEVRRRSVVVGVID